MLYLYHHNSSVCAAKPRIVFAEKGLAWEGETLDLNAGDQFKPAYLKLNPNAVVPTLVHDGRAVIESNIIIEYLDDAFPDRPLRPGDPWRRAQMREWLKGLDDGADGIHWAITVVSYGASYRWQLIELMGSDSREALEGALAKTMNPTSQSWTREVVLDGPRAPSFATAMRRLDTMLGKFEDALADQPWLAGPDYSLADVAYTSYATRLDLLGFGGMWRERPRVAAWYDRLRARASYAEVIGRYRPDFLSVIRERGARCWPEARRLLAA